MIPAAKPRRTRCATCGIEAAEIVCHICKTPRSGFEYSPPLERICPYCGAKHAGPWRACSPCKAALDSGDSR